MDETNIKNNVDSSKGTGGSKTVKIILWIGLCIILVAMGGYIYYQYHSITQKNNEISTLSNDKTSLENEKQSLMKNVSDITDTINEVANKLLDVRKKQVVITELITRTEEASQRQQILGDITAIERQLELDKRDIAELTKKMQQSGIKIKSLENMVTRLRNEVDKHVQTMADLRSIIEHKNEVLKQTENSLKDTETSLIFAQSELKETSRDLEETRNTLDETLNTAYYVIGTKQELKEKNIIDEEGRFFQKKSLNLSGEIDESSFTKIDITKNKEFTIASDMKQLKVLPLRSESSYQIENTGENQSVLKVIDPEKFWKIKYVALVIKG